MLVRCVVRARPTAHTPTWHRAHGRLGVVRSSEGMSCCRRKARLQTRPHARRGLFAPPICRGHTDSRRREGGGSVTAVLEGAEEIPTAHATWTCHLGFCGGPAAAGGPSRPGPRRFCLPVGDLSRVEPGNVRGLVSLLADEHDVARAVAVEAAPAVEVAPPLAGSNLTASPPLAYLNSPAVRTTSSRQSGALAHSGVSWVFSSCRHPFRRQWHVARRRHGR